MAPINQALLNRIADHQGISDKAVYARIAKIQSMHPSLSRPDAALLLASQLHININKFTSDAQRQAIARATHRGGDAAPFILSPSSAPAPAPRNNAKRRNTLKTNKPSKQVWVVVGRNTKINRAMMQFLRSLSLQPLDWANARKLTGKANPYIGDVLKAAFAKAQRVVVLMTPDDEARLRNIFWSDDDEDFERKLTHQPRPNVLFEAGYAMGMYPDNTVLVRVGKLRQFSDISGRHVVKLTNSTETRQELAHRLKDIGLAVDMDSADWHSDGDFSAV
jgi:predicted nucleotide-binding protein